MISQNTSFTTKHLSSLSQVQLCHLVDEMHQFSNPAHLPEQLTDSHVQVEVICLIMSSPSLITPSSLVVVIVGVPGRRVVMI